MNVNVADLAITSLETITAFDAATGAYRFTLDELQNATLNQTQDQVEITGRQGRRLAILKRNKAVTISGSNGLVSSGLLELQTGNTFTNGVTTVQWTDYLAVSGGVATTNYKAVGTAGAEIIDLYVKQSNNVLSTRLEQDATPSDGKFAYDPETRQLTFSGIADGTEIAVYYKRNITANVLANASDSYSTTCTLYVDALAEDSCANVYRIQIYIPKASFSGEFSLELGDDQTVHDFEAEALGGACGLAANLWTYTIFGVNDTDSNALTGIAITTPPSDTTYSVGDTFAPAGMVVTASYSDGSTAVLNSGAYTYAPNGALAATDASIVVSYTEGGVTKSARQAITVS